MGLPLTWSLNICCQPKEQPFSTNIHAYSVHRLTHIHFSCVHVYLKANLYACCCCNFFLISSFLLFSLLLSSLALNRIKRLAVPSTDKAYDAEKEAEAKEKTKQALVEAFEASHAAAVKGKTAALHCSACRQTCRTSVLATLPPTTLSGPFLHGTAPRCSSRSPQALQQP